MNTKLTNAALVVLTICALTLTGLFVRRELMGSEPSSGPFWVANVDELATGAVIGPPSANHTVIEFGDFQCPYCARQHSELKALRSAFGDSLRIVYRHLPLSAIHDNAVAAAEASECARHQGAFTSFHDRLFDQQDSIGTKSWVRFADDAGVPDREAFLRCVEARQHAAAVAKDVDAATSIGISSTPTLVINGWVLPGLRNRSEIENYLRKPPKPRTFLSRLGFGGE